MLRAPGPASDGFPAPPIRTGAMCQVFSRLELQGQLKGIKGSWHPTHLPTPPMSANLNPSPNGELLHLGTSARH